MTKFNRWWILKPVVFLACLAPLAWISWALWLEYNGRDGGLGADPVRYVTQFTGLWTLRFLMITLAITPLRRITGINSLIRFRRMIGLFTFFQGFVHLMTYIGLDQFFMWAEILKDIIKRPMILSGMAAITMMVPLALTSTRKWIARIGGARWRMLHRLIYFSGAAGVLHYYYFEKSDIRNPATYALLLTVLLSIRVWYAVRRRTAKAVGPAVGAVYDRARSRN